MVAMQIHRDDPSRPDIVALLQQHFAVAQEHGDPETVHAFDNQELRSHDVLFFSARDNGELLGIGALRGLDDRHYEIKSMYTAASARRRGVGTALLEQLIATACDVGAERVSLATGTMDALAPARGLYQRMGFVECEPFGDYSADATNVHMTRKL